MGIAAGDFNGDQRLDLAVTNKQTGVTVLYGAVDGSFGDRRDFAAGKQSGTIVTVDFNGDAFLDLAMANKKNEITVLYGAADGSFGFGQSFAVGKSPRGIISGDFNGDDRLDLAIANEKNNTVSLLFGQAGGSFSGRQDFAVGKDPVGLASADFDGDGLVDLAVTNRHGKTVSVLLGRAGGSFADRMDFAVGREPWGVATGDFNAGGFTDLAIANRGDNDVAILFNQNHTVLPVVTLSATDPQTGEPDNDGAFMITRTSPVVGALTIDFAISGSAANGEDYVAIDTSVTIPDGQASVAVLIEVIDDLEDEPIENVVLTLTADPVYLVGSVDTATMSITDDDGEAPLPVVTIAAIDPLAAEPDDDGAFAVLRSGNTDGALTVHYAIGGSANNSEDYTQITGAVTIADGQAFAAILIEVVDDAEMEGFEDVVLILTADPDYVIGSAAGAVVIIADDDIDVDLPLVSLLATDSHAAEPNDPGKFTLIRTGDLGSELVVNYSIGGSAVNGTDYNAIGVSVIIRAGEILADIVIDVKDDGDVEGSKDVLLNLLVSPAYLLGTARSDVVTIADGDADPNLPIVSVFATDSHAAEPDDHGKFTVIRSGSPTGDLLVRYMVTGTAAAGSDYEEIDGTVMIPAGEIAANIAVRLIDDLEVEGDEKVMLILLADPAYNVGVDDRDPVIIHDDDQFFVSITATDPTAGEPGDDGRFTVSRTGGVRVI